MPANWNHSPSVASISILECNYQVIVIKTMLHLLFRCQLEIVFAILYFHFDSMIDEVFWMPTSLTSRDIIFRTFCSFYKFRAYTAIYLICQTYSLFSSFSSFFVCMRRVDVATSQPPVSFGGKYSYTVDDCVIP